MLIFHIRMLYCFYATSPHCQFVKGWATIWVIKIVLTPSLPPVGGSVGCIMHGMKSFEGWCNMSYHCILPHLEQRAGSICDIKMKDLSPDTVCGFNPLFIPLRIGPQEGWPLSRVVTRDFRNHDNQVNTDLLFGLSSENLHLLFHQLYWWNAVYI